MLITEEYKELNKQLHAGNKEYGVTSKYYANDILAMCNALNDEDILDYGCGKAELARLLPFKIQSYDPCIEKYSNRPRPANILVCIDVLEHIEPECLDDVLEDISSFTKKSIFLTVATAEALKKLPDGRNAHLIVQDYKKWLSKLWEHFTLVNYSQRAYGFIFIGEPK
jgi:hypothetical protein|tara:strand:- start:1244 stop:1747 length:504 start_codon:yes stop_codon:yes gene_type:complete